MASATKTYAVLLPESSAFDRRNLWGLGVFLRGEPRELVLDKAQADALRNKGFELKSKRPRPEITEGGD